MLHFQSYLLRMCKKTIQEYFFLNIFFINISTNIAILHTHFHVPPVVFTRVKTFTKIFKGGSEALEHGKSCQKQKQIIFTFL